MNTTMTRTLTCALVVCGLGFGFEKVSGQDIGPTNGTLVIVGGALQDPAIWERFVELAGGPRRHLWLYADSMQQHELRRLRVRLTLLH